MEYKILEELSEIKSIIKKGKNLGYMDLKQLVQYTNTSSSTLRRRVKTGELKCSKKLGKLLFHVSDIDKWLRG